MQKEILKPIPLSYTIYIGIAGLAAAAILQTGLMLQEPVDYLLIITSLTQTIYAMYLIQRENRRYGLISPLALYSLLLILHFSIPGILVALRVLDFANEDNLDTAAKAQLFVLVGFIFFHCGCVVMMGRRRNEKCQEMRTSAPWNSNCLKAVLLVFSTFGWLDRIYIVSKSAYFQISRTTIGELNEQFHAALRLGEQLPGIAMILVWIYFWNLRSRKYSGWWWSGCLLWFAELAYWLPTGRKENVILTVLLPLMIRYLFTRKLPSVRTLVIAMLFIVALFPAAYYYRSAMEIGGLESFTETIRSSAAAIDPTKAVTVQPWWSIIGARISLLEPVSASVRIVDSGTWSPFMGRTYGWALYSIIPRVFWRSKPDFHYGTAFGHAAGMLQSTDNQTSVSVTYFGEAYLNFLWPGVVMMFFIGMIFGLIYKHVLTGYSQATWALLYAVTLPVILYVGGTFALHFSGLLQQIVIFGIIAQFMSRRRNPIAADNQGN